jgi:hypothetical protein
MPHRPYSLQWAEAAQSCALFASHKPFRVWHKPNFEQRSERSQSPGPTLHIAFCSEQ